MSLPVPSVTTGGPSVSTRSDSGSTAVMSSSAVVAVGSSTICWDMIWPIDSGLVTCDVIVGPK